MDHRALARTHYADRAPLAARQNIYRWQSDPVNLPAVATELLAHTTGLVLDVGCGPARYTEHLREHRPDLHVLPLDLSPAMAAETRADVCALPIRTDAADAALAMHMLYHAQDIPTAIAELRRVIRPGGLLLAATNGTNDKPELDELWTTTIHDLTGHTPHPLFREPQRFTVDDDSALRAHFTTIDVTRYERFTDIPDPDAVIAYVDSIQAGSELPHDLTWPDFLTAASHRIKAHITTHGTFRITGRFGIYTCR